MINNIGARLYVHVSHLNLSNMRTISYFQSPEQGKHSQGRVCSKPGHAGKCKQRKQEKQGA